MPLYEMYCTQCEKEVIIKQSIHDALPTECTECKGELRQKIYIPTMRTCCGQQLVERCQKIADHDIDLLKKGDSKAFSDLSGDKVNKLKQK
jgi:putative FmdB family regulatory protein